MEADRDTAVGVLARGGSQAEAARAAGVNRSTVLRWLDEPEFIAALTAASHGASQNAASGLGDLVPQAVAILQGALDGTTGVSAARARIALDIVKAAASLGGVGGGESQLIDRIREIDAAAGTRDD